MNSKEITIFARYCYYDEKGNSIPVQREVKAIVTESMAKKLYGYSCYSNDLHDPYTKKYVTNLILGLAYLQFNEPICDNKITYWEVDDEEYAKGADDG